VHFALVRGVSAIDGRGPGNRIARILFDEDGYSVLVVLQRHRLGVHADLDAGTAFPDDLSRGKEISEEPDKEVVPRRSVRHPQRTGPSEELFSDHELRRIRQQGDSVEDLLDLGQPRHGEGPIGRGDALVVDARLVEVRPAAGRARLSSTGLPGSSPGAQQGGDSSKE
jgi:hypothetical protein